MFEAKPAPVINPFKIGNIDIPNPVVLAPMAGITDIVFREIIKSMGAGLVYTEMISCQALHFNNKKTWRLADFSPAETPVAVQIFGGEPDLMGEAAKRVEESGFSIIDINLGCSVPKVIKAGAGAALSRDLPRLQKVLQAVVKAVKIPVTIKIRIGWSRNDISAFQICRMAHEIGISAIAIHGRTSVQKYSGEADWNFIKELQEKIRLPLIGNGDIKTPRGALDSLKFSGCPGIMIGRETLSNPWIIRDTVSLLQGKEIQPKPSPEDLRNLVFYQLDRLVERYGEESGVEKMRKFAAWYTRGLRNSARFREHIFHAEKTDQVKEVFGEFTDRLTHNGGEEELPQRI